MKFRGVGKKLQIVFCYLAVQNMIFSDGFMGKKAIRKLQSVAAVNVPYCCNQQKVVIAKCLNAEATVLLMDEPSRGIDVGAKEEIHGIIRDLAAQGAGVIIFSSEYQEILNLCDRILLVADGRIIKELSNSEASAEELLQAVTQTKRQKP